MVGVRLFRGSVLLILALALTVLAAAASAQEVVATLGSSVLFVPAGARPIGLGERYAGVTGDVHALVYNPAGLAFQDDAEAIGTFAPIGKRGTRDFEHWFVGGSIRFGRGGTLGLSYDFLDQGGMVERALVPPDSARLTEDESMTRIGYGVEIKRWLGIGVEFKSHTTDFLVPVVLGGEELVRTILVDLGASVRGSLHSEGLTLSRLSAGVTVENLGEDLKYGIPERKVVIPAVVRAGAAYELVSGRHFRGRSLPLVGGMAVVEYAGAIDSDFPLSELGAGLEVRLIEILALRGGVSTRLRDRGDSDNSAVNAGIGVIYPRRYLRRGLPIGLELDYARRQEIGTGASHNVFSLSAIYKPPD